MWVQTIYSNQTYYICYKNFAMVNPKVFYTGNLEIYASKQPKDPYLINNKPTDIIKRLAEPIYSSGHNITADNWFINVNLISNLKKKWLSHIGTVHRNKSQLPPNLCLLGRECNLLSFGADCTLLSHIPKKGKILILVSSMHSMVLYI